MNTEELKKLATAHTNVNLLLLRLSRMQREVSKLERPLTYEEIALIEKTHSLIQECVNVSPSFSKSGPENLGWGPI